MRRDSKGRYKDTKKEELERMFAIPKIRSIRNKIKHEEATTKKYFLFLLNFFSYCFSLFKIHFFLFWSFFLFYGGFFGKIYDSTNKFMEEAINPFKIEFCTNLKKASTENGFSQSNIKGDIPKKNSQKKKTHQDSSEPPLDDTVDDLIDGK